MKLPVLATLLLFSSHTLAEDFDSKEFVVDLMTNKYVHVCSTDGEKIIAKEVCAKGWPELIRKRSEILRPVASAEGIKKNDYVMVRVRKSDDQIHWVLAQTHTIYENGKMELLEYYDKRFGYSPGTRRLHTEINHVAKPVNDSTLSGASEVCVKEDFTINYSYDNQREFSFKKGDKLNLHEIYSNNHAAISIQSPSLYDRLQGYGINGRLPIPSDKIERCEENEVPITVNDQARSAKDQVVAPRENIRPNHQVLEQ